MENSPAQEQNIKQNQKGQGLPTENIKICNSLT